MPPRSQRPPAVSSQEVRALLRRADRLFAEGAKLQALAKQALIEHFRQGAADQPTAEDRAQRQRISRRVRKK